MNNTILRFAGIAPFLLLGCTDTEPAETENPYDAFWSNLSSHCGKAYNGTLTSKDEVDVAFRDAELVMHVRECSDTEIRVPFHVREAGGEWDRSRTWVFTRTDKGLRLKHDHRHADGAPDAVTMYGGDTSMGGTGRRHSFPVDRESIEMFKREGLDASVTNVWSVGVDPASDPEAKFSYRLQRKQAGGAPEDRDFRVEFDATKPATPPPAPWGSEDAPSS
ncbi:hypothetical protein ACXYL9_00475 [Qipengyuania sp. CAU 1752]